MASGGWGLGVGEEQNVLRTIDRFAGAGGLTHGFETAGRDSGTIAYEPVLAVEHDAVSARTYKSNFGVTVFDGVWVPETLSWLVRRLFGIR